MTYLESVAAAIKSEVDPNGLPEEDTFSLFLIYAVLALAKGKNVTSEDVHNAWAAWMLGKGRRHESIREFRDLPDAIKREDLPYVEAIHRAAESLTKGLLEQN